MIKDNTALKVTPQTSGPPPFFEKYRIKKKVSFGFLCSPSDTQCVVWSYRSFFIMIVSTVSALT